MADSNGIIPDISYNDDGVSTIRISTLDKKGHILKDKPGSVQYSPPQTGYVNQGYLPSTSVQQVKPQFGSGSGSGEIIEPVLVREKPDGDEIVPATPLYNYKEHHPPIVPQQADIYRPESSRVENLRSDTSDIGVNDNSSIISTSRTTGILKNSTTSIDDNSSVLSTSTASILKKSGDQRRRTLQQKKISWNENVKIREAEEKDKVSVTELQKEDHEYNPIDNPREESFHRSPEPLDNGHANVPEGAPASITTLPPIYSPPNGEVDRYEEVQPPSPRHVHPYGAEHFPERDYDRPKDEENSKWCMRITIVVLIILLTFAVIGCIVLGLLYAWSSRVNWDQDNEDLRSNMKLLGPPPPNDKVFPQAYYSNSEGAPAYFLVMGSDSFQDQTPTTQRYMTWHRGKPMKLVSKVTGSVSSETVVLGDPLETDGAVFSLLLEPTKTYSASIDGAEHYSLISFSATAGDFLTWTSNKR